MTSLRWQGEESRGEERRMGREVEEENTLTE